MNEQSTIQFLNQFDFFNLTKSKETYSSYDAYDSNYLVEIKNRRKYYSDKLIECSKLFVNYQKATLERKKFLYVVTDEKGVWVYSISKHIETIIKQRPIKIPCPSKTDFYGGKIINKYCYTLKEEISTEL